MVKWGSVGVVLYPFTVPCGDLEYEHNDQMYYQVS